MIRCIQSARGSLASAHAQSTRRLTNEGRVVCCEGAQRNHTSLNEPTPIIVERSNRSGVMLALDMSFEYAFSHSRMALRKATGAGCTSLLGSTDPVEGLVLWFRSHASMATRSNVWPACTRRCAHAEVSVSPGRTGRTERIQSAGRLSVLLSARWALTGPRVHVCGHSSTRMLTCAHTHLVKIMLAVETGVHGASDCVSQKGVCSCSDSVTSCCPLITCMCRRCTDT